MIFFTKKRAVEGERVRPARRPAGQSYSAYLTHELATLVPDSRPSAGRRELRTGRIRSQSDSAAFTLVEIAICLGIIGFALVAIIGILPAGLQVQRDNREDTIINQEGTFLMEAIRNGAEGLFELTNRVEEVVYWDVGKASSWQVFDWDPQKMDPEIDTGREIIGRLSTPSEYTLPSGTRITNEMRAIIRARTGAAVDVGLGDVTSDVAFSYQVRIRNFEYKNSSPHYEQEFRDELADYLHELRLEIRWPVLPNGNVGAGRQVFRSLVSGRLIPDKDDSELYFFQP
ncbi:MAG: hypothetical protein L0Y58_20130 [Verrucomicrobia subdivision 3 bacterium]|nr:hypothetical protein [Limisphaerales bacterium]